MDTKSRNHYAQLTEFSNSKRSEINVAGLEQKSRHTYIT